MRVTEGQLLAMIRKVVRQEFAFPAMAAVVQNTDQLRTTFQRNATDSQFANARNVQPYGVSSRAPAATPVMVVPVGGNSSNVNLIGVHDPAKPAVNDGEVMFYNATGQRIYLQNGAVRLGTAGGAHPVSFGDTVQSIFSQFLALYAAHTHIDSTGHPTQAPNNASSATSLKSSPVDDGAMNSQIVFTG